MLFPKTQAYFAKWEEHGEIKYRQELESAIVDFVAIICNSALLRQDGKPRPLDGNKRDRGREARQEMLAEKERDPPAEGGN